jgi:hypothetical protein
MNDNGNGQGQGVGLLREKNSNLQSRPCGRGGCGDCVVVTGCLRLRGLRGSVNATGQERANRRLLCRGQAALAFSRCFF